MVQPKGIFHFLIVSGIAIMLAACNAAKAPQKPGKVRLAKIVVDSAQLENYKTLLKEEIEASIAKEAGVLTLYAVFEKERPTHLTILEIYATEEAYQAHLKTTHFLKYKNGTAHMVRELELVETDPLVPELKIK
ncbi:putative quinol monooxygenase [Chitinophaga lutea]|nr:antibiotic biosynthesis monooxygenase [Chitinophaga lutea]